MLRSEVTISPAPGASRHALPQGERVKTYRERALSLWDQGLEFEHFWRRGQQHQQIALSGVAVPPVETGTPACCFSDKR